MSSQRQHSVWKGDDMANGLIDHTSDDPYLANPHADHLPACLVACLIACLPTHSASTTATRARTHLVSALEVAFGLGARGGARDARAVGRAREAFGRALREPAPLQALLLVPQRPADDLLPLLLPLADHALLGPFRVGVGVDGFICRRRCCCDCWQATSSLNARESSY